MKISVFGPLTVSDGARLLTGSQLGGNKCRSLLEILVLARGHPVSKESIAEKLWGDDQPRNIASTVEHYVCVLRQIIFVDADAARSTIVTGPGTYRLDPTKVEIDLDLFDEFEHRARRSSPAERQLLLTEAVELVHGELLEDNPYAPWAEADRQTYRDSTARLHLWLALDHLVGNRPREAVFHAQQALTFAPFSEQALRILMVANHVLGLADLARNLLVQFRSYIGDRLGSDLTTLTEQVGSAIDAGVPAPQMIVELFESSGGDPYRDGDQGVLRFS
jgi:DNA-binding SARP family transcriptional activator